LLEERATRGRNGKYAQGGVVAYLKDEAEASSTDARCALKAMFFVCRARRRPYLEDVDV
jgi:hypothetical protein